MNEEICYLHQNNQDNHSNIGPKPNTSNVASLLLPRMKHGRTVEVVLGLVRQCLEEDVLALNLQPKSFKINGSRHPLAKSSLTRS